MSNPPMRLLLIEDNLGDSTLIRAMIDEVADGFSIECKNYLKDGLERLAKGGIDVVLLDLSLPDSSGPETFQTVCSQFPQVPVILMTGLNAEEMSLKAMSQGVQDYLVKGNVDSNVLIRSIRYAVERKKTEISLLETHKALTTATKMAALGTMAGGVAHEINNSLTLATMTISHIMDELQNSALEPAKIKKDIELIDRALIHIAKITRGLRTFARDAQTDPLVSESLQMIIDDTLALCGNRFKAYGVELKLGIPKNLLVKCRASQLVQVFLNLVNNSIDAIENLPEKWVEFAAVDLATTIEISVTDSGTGIPSNISGKLFDPFFTTKPVGKGTGLGLSISHGLISGHHGELFLDEKCKNTRFVIRFPKAILQAQH